MHPRQRQQHDRHTAASTCLVEGRGRAEDGPFHQAARTAAHHGFGDHPCAVTLFRFRPTLIGITLAVIGTTTARSIFWSIPTRFLTGTAAAGGLAFINAVGTIGGFVGPFLMGWLKDATGSYSADILGKGAMLLLSTALAASLRVFVKDE
jgi:nitrate/nitrite transporter NarK